MTYLRDGERTRDTDSGSPRRVLLIALAVASLLLVSVLWLVLRPSTPPLEPLADPEPPVDTVFHRDSYWHTPLPADAARHPDSDRIIDFLRRTNADDGCVQLSGAGDNPWGMPIYEVSPGDPVNNVKAEADGFGLPEEFAALRIPQGARPMGAEDAEMVIFDEEAGYVASLHGAAWLFEEGTWAAVGGSVAYFDSNGLDQWHPESDDPRNWSSHRGLNGAVMAVRHDSVLAGRITNVLKVGVKESSPEYRFPMTGSDGRSDAPEAPPQGTRLRIRPDVDLDAYGLPFEARVIATALQEFGIIIGDSTAGPIELKLERPVIEEPPWQIDSHALCGIPLTDFEVIDPDFDRSLAAR